MAKGVLKHPLAPESKRRPLSANLHILYHSFMLVNMLYWGLSSDCNRKMQPCASRKASMSSARLYLWRHWQRQMNGVKETLAAPFKSVRVQPGWLAHCGIGFEQAPLRRYLFECFLSKIVFGPQLGIQEEKTFCKLHTVYDITYGIHITSLPAKPAKPAGDCQEPKMCCCICGFVFFKS